VLAQENLKPETVVKADSSAEEVIQIDGGHIPIKDKDKRSFEALSAIAYRPENIRTVDKHHREIGQELCPLSQGWRFGNNENLHPHGTQARNDGADDGDCPCRWCPQLLVRDHEPPHRQQLLCILDWFHIAMRFQNVRSAVDEAYTDTLERVKWTLWHGKPKETLSKLELW